MTIPATPPLLHPPSPPPPSGSQTGRAAPLTTRISHLTVLPRPPIYPVSLQTNGHCAPPPPSNNANVHLIWFFPHRCFIGVSLIRLQQHWYENAVLDNAEWMTGLWTVCPVGWKIICLSNRVLWNQFEYQGPFKQAVLNGLMKIWQSCTGSSHWQDILQLSVCGLKPYV